MYKARRYCVSLSLRPINDRRDVGQRQPAAATQSDHRRLGAWPDSDHARRSYHGHGHCSAFGGGSMPMSRHRCSSK
jgi:hypothetical protein